MSSDNYLVRIEAREGRHVTMRFVVSGNGGFSGEPRPGGRATILLAVCEADRSFGADESSWSPLYRQLVADAERAGTESDPYAAVWQRLRDATWVEANIDRFIERVTVTRARLLAGDWEDERAFDAWLAHEADGDDDGFRALLWKWAPYFVCVVDFADDRFAMHLAPGLEFGTAAYASWREDPSDRLRAVPKSALDIFGVDGTGRPQ